ncbi:hypothetical protein LTR85_009142 [Meristemomyces frigidus]|nr:hypothetical protein LTR85_009142 [Meristemomyces frigidus]
MFKDEAKVLGESLSSGVAAGARTYLDDAEFPGFLVDGRQAAVRHGTAAISVDKAASAINDTATEAKKLIGPVGRLITMTIVGQAATIGIGASNALSQARASRALESLSKTARCGHNAVHQGNMYGQPAVEKAEALREACWLIVARLRREQLAEKPSTKIKLQLVGGHFMDSVRLRDTAAHDPAFADLLLDDLRPLCNGLQQAIDKAERYLRSSATNEKSEEVFCVFVLTEDFDPAASRTQVHQVRVPYIVAKGSFMMVAIGTNHESKAHAIAVKSKVETENATLEPLYKCVSAGDIEGITVLVPKQASLIKRGFFAGSGGALVGVASQWYLYLPHVLPHTWGAVWLVAPGAGVGVAVVGSGWGAYKAAGGAYKAAMWVKRKHDDRRGNMMTRGG